MFDEISFRAYSNRDLRPGTAPDSIIHPVRLTSSFAFTLEDSSQPRVNNVFLSRRYHSPLTRHAIAIMVMTAIVIPSSDRIEDVRLDLRGYNGVTKIAGVANSDLFDTSQVSSVFRLQSLENRMESKSVNIRYNICTLRTCSGQHYRARATSLVKSSR